MVTTIVVLVLVPHVHACNLVLDEPLACTRACSFVRIVGSREKNDGKWRTTIVLCCNNKYQRLHYHIHEPTTAIRRESSFRYKGHKKGDKEEPGKPNDTEFYSGRPTAVPSDDSEGRYFCVPKVSTNAYLVMKEESRAAGFSLHRTGLVKHFEFVPRGRLVGGFGKTSHLAPATTRSGDRMLPGPENHSRSYTCVTENLLYPRTKCGKE